MGGTTTSSRMPVPVTMPRAILPIRCAQCCSRTVGASISTVATTAMPLPPASLACLARPGPPPHGGTLRMLSLVFLPIAPARSQSGRSPAITSTAPPIPPPTTPGGPTGESTLASILHLTRRPNRLPALSSAAPPPPRQPLPLPLVPLLPTLLLLLHRGTLRLTTPSRPWSPANTLRLSIPSRPWSPANTIRTHPAPPYPPAGIRARPVRATPIRGCRSKGTPSLPSAEVEVEVEE